MKKNGLLWGILVLFLVAFTACDSDETEGSSETLLKQIAVGFWDSCAVLMEGAVYCWGHSSDGVLGDVASSAKPRKLAGLESGVKAITLSPQIDYACALFETGKIKCWGANLDAQLALTGRTGFMAVSVAFGRSCGVTESGAALCCGGNPDGLMLGTTSTDTCSYGDPTPISYPCSRTPLQVDGLPEGVADISAGGSMVCVLMKTGGVKCWGYNDTGELGDGTRTNRPAPGDVVGLTSGVKAISAGVEHACAITASGALKCWGLNRYGQLGDGTSEDRLVPTDVYGLSSGVIGVSAGESHTCAIMNTGAVKCWGAYALLGQETSDTDEICTTQDLSGNKTCSRKPLNVPGLSSGVVSLAAGSNHSCVVLSSGRAKCWGVNGNYQLGDGTDINRQTPVELVW